MASVANRRAAPVHGSPLADLFREGGDPHGCYHGCQCDGRSADDGHERQRKSVEDPGCSLDRIWSHELLDTDKHLWSDLAEDYIGPREGDCYSDTESQDRFGSERDVRQERRHRGRGREEYRLEHGRHACRKGSPGTRLQLLRRAQRTSRMSTIPSSSSPTTTGRCR